SSTRSGPTSATASSTRRSRRTRADAAASEADDAGSCLRGPRRAASRRQPPLATSRHRGRPAPRARPRLSARVVAAPARRLRGAAWIGCGLGYRLLLRALPVDSRLAAFAVRLAVFAGDTAAYVFGRLLGRHKLAPTVSPGKTWEGFFAGVIATVAVIFFALY